MKYQSKQPAQVLNEAQSKKQRKMNDQSKRCDECKAENQLLLHILYERRDTFRHLCTNCFLNTQRHRFCPICFEVYDNPLPPQHQVACVTCSSISHVTCRTIASTACPSCSSPGYLYFDLKRSVEESSLALLAAARIAEKLMNRFVEIAREIARKRQEEAKEGKKKVMEAMEMLELEHELNKELYEDCSDEDLN